MKTGSIIYYLKKGIIHSLLILFLTSVSCIQKNEIVFDDDWIIDGIEENHFNSDIYVYGNVIIKNEGSLTLDNSTLNIVSSYDEEHFIQLQGPVHLITSNSTIKGKGGQTYIDTIPVETILNEDNTSPQLDFTNSTVTNHSGIRLKGETILSSINSDIEEFQVHDSAQAIITGGYIYPVFFFDDETITLDNLITGNSVDKDIIIPDGFRILITDGEITGWQIDLIDTANVTVNNSEGITLSMHTPGNLPTEVYISGLTSDNPTSGNLNSLGPIFSWNFTQIELFNLYTLGNDRVVVTNTKVNEPQCDGNSQISLENCEVCFNLGQCYDYGNMIINNSQVIKLDPSDQPSCLTDDNSTMNFSTSDLTDLYITAIDNSIVNINNCTGVDISLYDVEGNGKIYVDGVQVLP